MLKTQAVLNSEMVKSVRNSTADRKRWVLIMDDASAVRGSARRMLEKAGYRVYVSGSCEEIVECYKTARECGYPFDAVILPAASLETEAGEDAIRKLHALDTDVKVIIAGGANPVPFGCKVAAAKPLTGEELNRVLRLQSDVDVECA